jgi:hypothetical protein
MFRRIATDQKGVGFINEERANLLFTLHPTELYALLEMAWLFQVDRKKFDPDQTNKTRITNKDQLGDPRNKSALKPLPEKLLELFPFFGTNKQRFTFLGAVDPINICEGAVLWDHLIYAYIIESTQIYRVFHKLIQNYARGEFEISLDAPTQQWLHNTEVLWFADPPVYSTFNMVSRLRPDMGGTRRSAYYQMFGFNLPGDTAPDGKAYPFHQPKSSNSNFRRNFERFCEEIWIGIVNDKVTIGPVPIDDESIQFNASEMQKNFLSQRNNGDITKQEFFYVAMLSWFHLTLEFNSPIVKAFGVNEQSPAQRLFALANIVGVPANGLSENMFRLADPMSLVLTLVETGLFNDNAKILYRELVEVGTGSPPPTERNPLVEIMRRIIFNYSQVSGRDLKVREGQNIASYPVAKGNGIPATNGKPVALTG